MNINWQKIGILGLIIAAAIGFGLIIYFFFFAPLFIDTSTSTLTSTSTNGLIGSGDAGDRITSGTSTGGLDISQDQINQNQTNSYASSTGIDKASNVKILVSDPVSFSSLSQDGQVTYYNNNDCKFYSVSGNGQIKSLSENKFCNLSNVVWSHNSSQAVMQYPDGSNVVYNFDTGQKTILPKHWQDFSFSPNDQQIAFKSIAVDEENRFLAIGNSNGSNLKIIESIGGVEGKFQINWSPNNQMIATFNESKDLDRSNIYFVGLNNENFKSMTVEGRGFSGVWSPQGNKIVYSVYNSDNYSPELWISSANSNNIGSGRQKIDLQTWSDKCSFASEDKLFCAVPQNMPYGAGLDRSVVDGIYDNLYEIDLNTGAKKYISLPRDFRIDKIMAPSSGNYIMFYSDANRIYRVDY